MLARLFAYVLAVLVAAGLLSAGQPVRAAPMTTERFRAKVIESSKNVLDVVMAVTVVYKDRNALEKVDPTYASLYEFKTASVSMKMPDKMKIDGKLGMVKFEYIINGFRKLFRAPAVNIRKKDDYSSSPAKLQDALDMGVITSSLWRHNRRADVVPDADAESEGMVKLKLQWPDAAPYCYVWLDARTLCLHRLEKFDGDGKTAFKIVYSNHRDLGGDLWVPTRVEMYAPDGRRAGASEMSDIRVNVGLQDSLFE